MKESKRFIRFNYRAIHKGNPTRFRISTTSTVNTFNKKEGTPPAFAFAEESNSWVTKTIK